MTSKPAETFGVFDFGLDAAQEERARRLHKESVVVDMLFQGPCGYRSFADIDIPAPTGNAEADYRAASESVVRKALAGQLDEFETCWRDSGITVGNRQIRLDTDYSGAALAQAQFDRFPWLVKALTATDVRRAKGDGKLAGVVTSQDAEGLDRKLERLQPAYDLGLRMIQLTYNMQNAFGGGCTERTDTGVSDLGVELIARMNELGIIVDISHCSRQTTLDACELSEQPVVASHTTAEALYMIDRAKNDEELHAIAESGGVIGIVTVPFFLAPGAGVTIEAMLDHIDYVSELVGWQHVAIGTDWPNQVDRLTLETAFLAMVKEIGFRDEHNIGTENLVGFDDYRDFPNITRGLVARGYDDEQIRGVLGQNVLRVFEAVGG